MLSFLRSRFRPQVSTLNTILVHQEALLHNYSHLQSLQPAGAVFPVLKSNAYGHGLQQVATILRESTAPLLCVDSFPEYQLVKKYSGKNVLVMGETLPENYKHYDVRVASVAVYTLETLKVLAAQGRAYRIHLFLNTGMNREGFQTHHLPAVLDVLRHAKQLIVEGVMSHFAMADEVDASFNLQQVETFKQMYAVMVDAGHTSMRRHIGNSAGIAKVQDDFFNAWRSGLAFYGYNPLEVSDPFFSNYEPLRPAFSLQSTVVSLQTLEVGDIVSYGGVFKAGQPTISATLPLGYYEGLPRAVSNTRQVKRNGVLLPQIGRVCMNICSVETLGHDVQVGDQIEVISCDSSAPNSIDALAKQCRTITYEVLVKFSEKIRRKIISN